MDHTIYYLEFRRRGLSPLASLTASLFTVSFIQLKRRLPTNRETRELVEMFKQSDRATLLALLRTVRETLSLRSL